MIRTIVAAAALALPVAGCTMDREAGGTCVADGAQALVGQALTDTAPDRIRRSARAASVRVQRPGDMMTMEFDPGRVTVTVDEAGRITRIGCG